MIHQFGYNYISNIEEKVNLIKLITDEFSVNDTSITIDKTVNINADLNVLGDSTIIDIDSYQTEDLHILTNNVGANTSLKISHNNNQNIFEAVNQDDDFIIIDKDANLGIKKIPTVELDILGSINFSGSIS